MVEKQNGAVTQKEVEEEMEGISVHLCLIAMKSCASMKRSEDVLCFMECNLDILVAVQGDSKKN